MGNTAIYRRSFAGALFGRRTDTTTAGWDSEAIRYSTASNIAGYEASMASVDLLTKWLIHHGEECVGQARLRFASISRDAFSTDIVAENYLLKASATETGHGE